MIDNPGEGLPADVSLADAGMAVLVTTAIVQTVVQMDGFQAAKADGFVKFCKISVQISDDIVACISYMAGIQADAHFL